MKSLRCISERETRRLLDQEYFGREYLKELYLIADVSKWESHRRLDRGLRSRVLQLAIEAYRRGEISRDRILELGRALRIAGERLRMLAEAARGE